MTTVTLSSFESNSAVTDGGALYFTAAVSGVLKVSIASSQFTANTAINGPAIYVFNANVAMKTVASTFYQNVAEISGGAVYYYATGSVQGTLSYKNSSFVSNVAGVSGAAIYADIATSSAANSAALSLQIETSSFQANAAGNVGGAVYLPNYVQTTISRSTFENNTGRKNAFLSMVAHNSMRDLCDMDHVVLNNKFPLK